VWNKFDKLQIFGVFFSMNPSGGVLLVPVWVQGEYANNLQLIKLSTLINFAKPIFYHKKYPFSYSEEIKLIGF